MHKELALKLLTSYGQELLKAMSEGKEIEIYTEGRWTYIPNPSLNCDIVNYRVKTFPKTVYILNADLQAGVPRPVVKHSEKERFLGAEQYTKFKAVL